MNYPKKTTDKFSELLRKGHCKKEIMRLMKINASTYQHLNDLLLEGYNYNPEPAIDSVEKSKLWEKEVYRLAKRLSLIRDVKNKLFTKYRELYNIDGVKLIRRNVAKKIQAFNEYEFMYTEKYRKQLGAIKLSDPYYQH